jgi:RsmE family RNA methyltransferase
MRAAAMNLLLLLPEDLLPESATEDRGESLGTPGQASPCVAELVGERARHLMSVLAVEEGSELRAGLLDGACGLARVVEVVARGAAQEPRVVVEFFAAEPPPPPLRATLVLALPRPKFLGRILQWAATMGVKEIVLAGSARVEKSYWGSSLLGANALRRHLILGLEQGRDTVLPRIQQVRRFRQLVDELLPRLAEQGDVWIAHGEASRAFPAALSQPCTVCVGPEGGWQDHELAAFAQVGGQLAHLGVRPLRVEAAVAVLLGRCLGAPR